MHHWRVRIVLATGFYIFQKKKQSARAGSSVNRLRELGVCSASFPVLCPLGADNREVFSWYFDASTVPKPGRRRAGLSRGILTSAVKGGINYKPNFGDPPHCTYYGSR